MGFGLRAWASYFTRERGKPSSLPASVRWGRLLVLGVLLHRFLRDAVLRRADLFLDLSDLIGLHVGRKRTMPLAERLLPFGGCLFSTALLSVDVAKVRVNIRIVRIAIERLAQLRLGFVVLALLVVNPTEAVEIRTVERLHFQRGLHHRFRFVEALAEIAEHEAVIVERRAVSGIHRDHFFELLFGAIEKLLALVNGAEQEIRGLFFARVSG